jgi:geranylgeranyl diphosphate synthase, type II
MQAPEELFELIEEYLGGLELAPELGSQQDSMRYALEGGKRIRAVICLATAEAVGARAADALPAAAALELVHAFSLVHDDLPALDDDDERRGRASTHVAFGEAVALLAGDALLAEAFRLVLTYPTPEQARELVTATLGMIGGQYLDITGGDGDLAELHRLKTGRLFVASVGLGLSVAEVPAPERPSWRAFGEELGFLFQIVDDVLDGDGYAARLGIEAASDVARDTAGRAHRALESIRADTFVLAEIVDALVVRTA